MSEGIQLIAEERVRQIEQEGWTPEHDDEHADGELAIAAGVVATVETPLDWEEADTRKATPQKWDKVASELQGLGSARGLSYRALPGRIRCGRTNRIPIRPLVSRVRMDEAI